MNLFVAVAQAKDRAEVVQAVRQWFEALPVLESRTRDENAAALFRALTPVHLSLEWPELLEAAKTDPVIWKGLRLCAIAKAETGLLITPGLGKAVLSAVPKRKKGRPSGQTPFEEQLHMRYARAVWCVYRASDKRYTLSTNSPNADNAFAIVACATGATFDVVRDAANKRRPQLERLAEFLDRSITGNKSYIGNCE